MPYLAGPAGKVMLLLIRGVWNSPSVEQEEAAQQYSMVQKPGQQGAILAGTGI